MCIRDSYKKLRPVVPYYQKKLGAFLDQYWDYYAKLCDFKMKPDAEVAKQLDIEFDQLFSTETVYDQLDDRISETREKKKSLLMVLTMPAIPLHNNAAELAYTHLRAHETVLDLVCRLLLEKKKKSSA